MRNFEDETPLIYTARTVNDKKPEWVAEKVASLAPRGAKVCVLGLAYKPDIDDLRESPSVLPVRAA
jgi:UDP-N-acetyl-D-mannosaminuronic acid dehydrogenase